MVLYDCLKRMYLTGAYEISDSVWIYDEDGHAVILPDRSGRFVLKNTDSLDLFEYALSAWVDTESYQELSDILESLNLQGPEAYGLTVGVDTDAFFPSPREKQDRSAFRLPEWVKEYCRIGDDVSKREDIRETRVYDSSGVEDYLSRYSPRTYAEGYLVVSNVLKNRIMAGRWKGKKKVYILDIGCGTGFASVGALTALIAFIPGVEEIVLELHDYNPRMLHCSIEVLREVQKRTSVRLVPYFHITRLDIGETADGEIEIPFRRDEYDLVLCFKAVNEMIFARRGECPGAFVFKDDYPYRKLASAVVGKLSPNGFFVLLDITMSNETERADNTAYNRLLSSGVRNAVGEGGEYSILLPTPCAFALYRKEPCPVKECPTQVRIKISDADDSEPVTFAVLCRSALAHDIVGGIREGDIVFFKKGKKKPLLCKRLYTPSNEDMKFTPGLKRAESDNLTDGFELLEV